MTKNVQLRTTDIKISSYGRLNTQRGKYMPRVSFNAQYASLAIGKVSFVVHRLVAAAFLGAPASPDLIVDHKDGIKTNNHWANLEYVEPAVNTLRAYRKLKVSKLRPGMSKPVILRVEASLLKKSGSS